MPLCVYLCPRLLIEVVFVPDSPIICFPLCVHLQFFFIVNIRLGTSKEVSHAPQAFQPKIFLGHIFPKGFPFFLWWIWQRMAIIFGFFIYIVNFPMYSSHNFLQELMEPSHKVLNHIRTTSLRASTNSLHLMTLKTWC